MKWLNALISVHWLHSITDEMPASALKRHGWAYSPIQYIRITATAAHLRLSNIPTERQFSDGALQRAFWRHELQDAYPTSADTHYGKMFTSKRSASIAAEARRGSSCLKPLLLECDGKRTGNKVGIRFCSLLQPHCVGAGAGASVGCAACA